MDRKTQTPHPQSREHREHEVAHTAAELSEKQRRHLRGLAHALKPVIRLGAAGLTEALAKETARALHDHELIKVKAPGGDRAVRDALFNDLAQRTGSALVHRIGNVAVLYRPREQLPRILLPEP
jgi:RNA-binding protein